MWNSAEAERLSALHELKFTPGGRMPAFDHVAQVALQHFNVPIALVSLVARTEQFFVGCKGLSVAGTPREHAFCRYTIRSDEVLVVEDATRDERFARNPFVIGEPFVRFYAGAPLILRDGIRLGTVCIIDTKPRVLNFGQKVVLKHLASIALTELNALN